MIWQIKAAIGIMIGLSLSIPLVNNFAPGFPSELVESLWRGMITGFVVALLTIRF